MSRAVRLTVGSDRVRAEVLRRGRAEWMAESEHAGPGDLAEVVARLAGTAGFPARANLPVVVELEPSVVQQRTLTDLPPVRRTALRALVAHQRSRFFRQNGKPLVTDVCWSRPKRGGAPLAHAVAVEEPWLDAVVAGCAAAGLRLDSISPEGKLGSRLDLLPPGERISRERRGRRANRRLAMVAGGMWLILLALVAYRLDRERRRVDGTLETLTAPATAVGEVRRKLRAGNETVTAVATAERERAEIFRRIVALVNSLPDSSHLASVEIGLDGAGSISGAARQPGRVLERLEAEASLSNPRLVGSSSGAVALNRTWVPFTIEFGPEAKR